MLRQFSQWNNRNNNSRELKDENVSIPLTHASKNNQRSETFMKRFLDSMNVSKCSPFLTIPDRFGVL